MDLSLLSPFTSPLIQRRVNCRVSFEGMGEGSYSVYSLEGAGEVMGLYTYTLIFVSDEVLGVEHLCDLRSSVTLSDEVEVLKRRKVYGYVSEASEYGSIGRKRLYRVSIVSPLHYLKLNRRYEIYQDKSVSSIIALILSRYEELLGISLEDKSDPQRYSIRHYCTQYNQSDYDFIRMLCEEEGLVLLCDSSTAEPYKLTLCTLNEHAPYGGSMESTFNRSKAFAVSGHKGDFYDPRKPSTEMRLGKSVPTTEPMRDNASSARLRSDLERFVFHERLDTYEGSLSKELGRYTVLDSERSYASQIRFRGESRDVMLKEASAYTLQDTKLFRNEEVIILSFKSEGFFPNALDELIEHDHTEKEQYSVTFEAIPASITYRPPYTITKPGIEGLHSAIVSKGDKETTAGANEIDVNELGEIRVIMHFDPNYPTTCYVPLNTLWSGERYGIRFLPRVNSEVLISYINGNIDRPVIVGTLHNGENAIPYDLPNTKTQSYIKTQTTPQYSDNEGYNEILFEDAQNNEQLNIRAQKDYNLLVLHDATEHIGHDRSERVDNDEDVTIRGYRHERVNKSKTETIDIAKALTIGAGYQVSVGAGKNETVGISSTEEVGVLKHIIAGEKYELRVGNTQIVMYADGTILVEGDDLDITATEHLEIIAPKIHIDKGAWTPEPICWECMIRNMEEKVS